MYVVCVTIWVKPGYNPVVLSDHALASCLREAL
jgi:hypothetical protein